MTTPTGLPQLPAGGGAAPAGLPDASKSPLLSFSDSLDAAVNLARVHRNKSSVDMMAPYSGTAKASDFNAILGGINSASDKTSDNLIKKVSTITQPDIVTATSDNGDVHGIDKNTGKVLWTAAGAGNKDNGGGGTGSDLPPGVTSAQITALKDALNQSKFTGAEADGKYVDPNLYLANFNNWVTAGHSSEQFFKIFPPATYINPLNTDLPKEILRFVGSTDVPSQFQ